MKLPIKDEICLVLIMIVLIYAIIMGLNKKTDYYKTRSYEREGIRLRMLNAYSCDDLLDSFNDAREFNLVITREHEMGKRKIDSIPIQGNMKLCATN